MKWLALAAVAIGCGRVGFDPLVSTTGHDDAIAASGSDAALGSGSGVSPSCAACMAAGGQCNGPTCVFVVIGAGPFTCPAGLACEIDCNASGVCGNIDCSMSAGCTIECNVAGSCGSGTIQCDPSGCHEYCRAANTCEGTTYTGAGGGVGVVECCGASSCSNLTGNQTTVVPGTCP
jgi:hypothetical protein